MLSTLYAIIVADNHVDKFSEAVLQYVNSSVEEVTMPSSGGASLLFRLYGL